MLDTSTTAQTKFWILSHRYWQVKPQRGFSMEYSTILTMSHTTVDLPYMTGDKFSCNGRMRTFKSICFLQSWLAVAYLLCWDQHMLCWDQHMWPITVSKTMASLYRHTCRHGIVLQFPNLSSGTVFHFWLWLVPVCNVVLDKGCC